MYNNYRTWCQGFLAQELETTKLLVHLLADLTDWRSHVFRYSNSIGLLLTCGRRTSTPDDSDMAEVRDNFDEYAGIQLRGGLPDYFPLLGKLPDYVFPSTHLARRHYVKDARAEILLSRTDHLTLNRHICL